MSTAAAKRDLRRVSERDIAVALVLEYAEQEPVTFSMLGFYDDDADFIRDVANRLNVEWSTAFVRKMTRVVRRLVNYGVLLSRMSSTHKEYCGEPTKQMSYWLKPGKSALIRRGKTEHTMDSMGETTFLLRHAYPEPEEVTS